MHLRTARNALFALVLTLTMSTQAVATTALSPLLQTILTNYGGREKIAAIRSITAKGQMVDLSKGKEGPYRRYLTKDGKLRTEALVTSSSSGDVRVYNNGSGWKNAGQKMQAVQGGDLNSLLAQFESFAFPLTFLSANIPLSYSTSGVIAGHPVETYILKLPKSPELTVQFDPASMLVHRVEWQGQNDASLAIEFSDYRFVDGVLFPFKVVNYAADIKVSEITLSSMTLNEPFAPSIFKP